MLRTASSLPLAGLLTLGSDPGPFPDRAASLLPGLLAATRTGLPPAGDDELTNSKIRCYVTASPPALLGARKRLSDLGAPLISLNTLIGHRPAPRRLHQPGRHAGAGRSADYRRLSGGCNCRDRLG